MRRQFFEQRQLRLVMIAAAAEAQQTKDAKRQGEGERVSRVLRSVRADRRQRLDRRPIDGESDRIDVASLPRAHPLGERSCLRRRRLRLGHPRAELQQASSCDMGQREIGIGCDGILQQLRGSEIRREQQIYRCDVARCSLGRAGAQR